MTLDVRQSNRRRRSHWWRALSSWQRMAVAVVVLGALVIGAALIYFEPGTRTLRSSGAPGASITATAVPFYPPGMRYYYRRSQWQPLDQQAPVQP
ncbi:MAG: hypothetical protein IPO81_27675 [Kouleothrix sp.]|nr:hypothetical protein [Kouleothrix sp.]